MRKKVKLKFDWNWKAQMSSLIRLLEIGTEEGKEFARKELMDLAKKLDKQGVSNSDVKYDSWP